MYCGVVLTKFLHIIWKRFFLWRKFNFPIKQIKSSQPQSCFRIFALPLYKSSKPCSSVAINEIVEGRRFDSKREQKYYWYFSHIKIQKIMSRIFQAYFSVLPKKFQFYRKELFACNISELTEYSIFFSKPRHFFAGTCKSHVINNFCFLGQFRAC